MKPSTPAPDRRLLLLALTLPMMLSACGPSSGLDVGVRHQGARVFFGLTPPPSPTPSALPQPPLAELVPNFPAPLEAPPPPPTAISTPVEVNPCPTPSPLAFPKEAAGTTATQPPAAATYNFRYSGTQTFNPGTPTAKVKVLPAAGTHQVTNVSTPAPDGSYSFDVVEVYNGTTTTTSYLVEPNGASALQGATQAGLYLQAMKTLDADGKTSSFTPQPRVELVPFPVNPGTQFQSAGVDPLTQTAMEEDSPGGQEGNHEHVATCGDVVDSWHVEINGRFVEHQGSSVTTFDIVFDVATQYGGLLVAQHVIQSGTDQTSGLPYKYDVSETIDSVPMDRTAAH